MSNYLYAEINIIGILILFLLLNNMNKSGFKDIPLDHKMFSSLMISNILIFVFDTGMWMTDGNPGSLSVAVNYISTTLYYISNPLICLLWLMYTDFKVYESRSGLFKRTLFYVIPAAVSSVLSLVSPFTQWFFIIDDANNYMRGPLFPVMAFVTLFYLTISLGIALKEVYKNGWEENKSVNLHMVIFPIGIIISAVIQILFFGISIIWVCSMLAFTSIYINIQNGEISTDHLTGLYNRRRLDQYLQRRIKARTENRILFAIMLDLDEFKYINDKYGHVAGDCALVETAGLLRKACMGSDDFIARMGGDEFIIVGERTGSEEIKRLMEDIYKYVSEYNQSQRSDFVLMLSMGYSIFCKEDTVDSFLAAADKEMYESKEERKLIRNKEWGKNENQ